MTLDPNSEPPPASAHEAGPRPAQRRSGPLAGVRVLDLTAVVLGPLATQILGDFGADVIKLEPPEGDLMRANGVSTVRGMSSIFLAINRNKRSLAIDLKQPAGLAAVQRLLPTVDVLVHNMRTAAIERLGLGHAACAAINPRLLYCVATGFGEDGPDAGQPAFDDVIQAACGLAGLIGDAGGPQQRPARLCAFADRRQDHRHGAGQCGAGRAVRAQRRAARASMWKCRCSRPWWPSPWPSTWAG